MNKRIWISWSFQRRSFELAKAFSAEFHSLGDSYTSRLQRYLFCIPKTLKLIVESRPEVLFVQNPSLILATMAVLLKYIFRYRLIIDLHTPYIRLNRALNLLFWKLQAFCAHRSDLTLVSNLRMKNIFADDNIMILPDKLPRFERPDTIELEGDFAIVFICTFSEDEPYEEVREAARCVEGTIHIYITGRYNKAGWKTEDMPSNVHLTGFLAEEAYADMLNSADAVMVLTTQPDCLVCGAYESVSLNKPMILSNHEALRSYFSRGAIYVDNTAASIAQGIAAIVPLAERLEGEIPPFRETLEREWREKKEAIEATLASMNGAA